MTLQELVTELESHEMRHRIEIENTFESHNSEYVQFHAGAAEAYSAALRLIASYRSSRNKKKQAQQ